MTSHLSSPFIANFPPYRIESKLLTMPYIIRPPSHPHIPALYAPNSLALDIPQTPHFTVELFLYPPPEHSSLMPGSFSSFWPQLSITSSERPS